jgi:DnaK suppressor protein
MTAPTPSRTSNAIALTSQQKAEIRAALAEVRQANETDLRDAQDKLHAVAAEGALTDASIREVVAGAEYMLEDANSILELVDAAQRRLETGEYGLCSSCGAPIPWERLLLRPYRSTCVECS